eukprot:CAMPEP_0113897772 /NCGR_PEP_ID=MMETSP0780_2-20120614/18923_1 /TAXON_ID=652834 /ORGANISM="Palpitomonas bilix" /LENGTH=327 /DNA_ID=CAMNT_0000889389 /DNA_START=150 /DNA_END=1133 /DNA_ORIENTATION=+ /assembly_acc=CAM_ASM_000599
MKYPDGSNYAYGDSNNGGSLSTASSTLADAKGALANTLNQMYDNADSIAYVMYDDETPSGYKPSRTTYAHSKGEVAYNSDGGFWLVHSVPRYPNPVSDGSYAGYPDQETRYGQSFLCLSLSTDALSTVGEILQTNRPYVYESNVASSVSGVVSTIEDFLNGAHDTSANSIQKRISTSDGSAFTAFAKTHSWGQEFYVDLVAPSLGVALYAETWMNGVNPLPSYCPSSLQAMNNTTSSNKLNTTAAVLKDGNYAVQNIRTLDFSSTSFKETMDHSKWAISQDESSSLVCIGDVNRQESMSDRGGGTVCFSSSSLWQSLNKAIDTVDQC